MKVWADLHTHTRYSHGRGTVRENVEAAIKKGLKAVGISEHGPANIGIGAALDDFKRIKEEIYNLREEYREIKILFGCEANIISVDGKLDLPEKLLEELDYVMVGLHPMVWGSTLRDFFHIFLGNFALKRIARLGPKVMEQNTRALVNAIKNYRIDVITHPGLHVPIDTATLAEAAASRGTALEINAGHGYMTIEYVRIAKSLGAKFTIGSDAHSPEKVGELKRGIEIAVKGGLTEEDVINAGRNWEGSLWRRI